MEETSLIDNEHSNYESAQSSSNYRTRHVYANAILDIANSENEPAVDELIREEPGIDNDTPTVPAKKGGCVRCRTETTIETFRDVKRGDHIAARGQIPCIGYCYDHHSIVTDITIISADGREANVTVVDVSEKDKRYVGCKCVGCKFCCIPGKMCSCCNYSYPIKERNFDLRLENGLRADTVWKKIDYRKRRNNYDITVERAKQLCQTTHGLEYSAIYQNCEHAASACVNASGDNPGQALVETLSVQTHRWCWRFWHMIFWILQAAFYAFNFCIYAVFVAKDKDFDIFTKPLRSFLKNVCYNPDNCVAGFDTTCDWMFVALFSILSTLVFIFIQCAFYQPLYIKGYICRQCLITARLDCFSRVFAFILIESMGIYLVKPIYKLAASLDTGRGTYAIIIGVSSIGAFLIYSVSSWITWILGACCIPSCKGVREFTKYYKFRGLARFCAFITRAICKLLTLSYVYLLLCATLVCKPRTS